MLKLCIFLLNKNETFIVVNKDVWLLSVYCACSWKALSIRSPEEKIQPQDPGGRLCCGPPWMKRMWNVSMFSSVHQITYYCDAEVQSSLFSAFHVPLIFCSFCAIALEVTLALLDAATDKDSKVQEQVRKSILTLGKQQPDRVVAMCQGYLLQHPKVKKSPVYHLAFFPHLQHNFK